MYDDGGRGVEGLCTRALTIWMAPHAIHMCLFSTNCEYKIFSTTGPSEVVPFLRAVRGEKEKP